ncbi:hypothetical protein BH11MYX2_BH11MYX2_12520 [soil metagenome]
MLVPPQRRVVGSLVLAVAAVSSMSVAITSATLAARTTQADPCSIPMEASLLSAKERGVVARHMLACRDLQHERISLGAYTKTIAEIDAASTKAAVPTSPPATQWASSVRGVSTQYTAANWSAAKVLGAPNVYPAAGDNVNAWASLGADDSDEWIEVGFAQPVQASAVEIYETYNPGAIRSIELITANGERITGYEGTPAAGQGSNVLRAPLGCTQQPIAAVRVNIASTQVAGWNEIDAIGLIPCAD